MKRNNTAYIFLIVLGLFLFPFAAAYSQVTSNEPLTPLNPAEDSAAYLPMLLREEASPSPTPSPTQQPTQTPPPSPTHIPQGTIIINHADVNAFHSIPDQYIVAASQLSMLFRHASQGNNISDGLDCIQVEPSQRRSSCIGGLDSHELVYNPLLDRSNWLFEFHAPPPAQNSGWADKVWLFVDRVNGPRQPGDPDHFSYVSFKFGYVDGITGTNLDDLYFHNNPSDNLPSIEDVELLQAQHPDKKVIHWTMGLAKVIGTPDSTSFNDQMRQYVLARENQVLFDLADILAHHEDGSPCTYQGYPALCDEYSTEIQGGHLNPRSKQRVAMALWVMMARIAGWNGQ